MICPKCNSENVAVQTVTHQKVKNKHHGICWWLCVGWWWIPFKWIFFTLPVLIVKIFKPKKTKIKNELKVYAVCQNCAHQWEINK
jgi:Zn finger protein HypA/HybF involved in hydrogenase expression